MSILQAGELASHFSLLAIDGREYSVPGDTGGRPAVIVFGKTTCGTCDLAFPYINRLHDAYPQGWTLLAVLQDGAREASAYAARQAMHYPVLIDAPAYEASILYDPPATPTLFLVGADGTIDFTTHGFSKADLNELSARLGAMLQAEPAEIAPGNDGKPAFKPG
jgi:hypothetical protein